MGVFRGKYGGGKKWESVGDMWEESETRCLKKCLHSQSTICYIPYGLSAKRRRTVQVH
jgi:hypothetical protein